jgi:transcriptional regulator with XRE-family HTH domain
VTKLREVDSARIRAARAAKGWSRDTLAYEIRRRLPNGEYLTTGRSIQRWESNSNKPAADIVPTVAEALDVSVAFLHGEEGDPDDEEEAAVQAALVDLSDALMAVLERRQKQREESASTLSHGRTA